MIFTVLREAFASQPKADDPRPDGIMGLLSLTKLMPVLVGCGVVATLGAAVMGGKLIIGDGVSDELRTALFFGLLTPATLIVGGALSMGAPTAKSLAEERRAYARARAEKQVQVKQAKAVSQAAQAAAEAHAQNIKALGSSTVPEAVARKIAAQNDALGFLIDRRSTLQQQLAKRSAGVADAGPYAARNDRAAAARALFAGGAENYENEAPAPSKLSRVA
ncbi:MAG: hypothetical protein AAF684_07365 [Pseudomonadota bacterium]